jgi:hypothetical protein
MAIYAIKTDRMDITLDLSSGYIFVQQKWRYNWIDESGKNPWTLQEKRDFHNKADQLIWKFWSSKAYAFMTGNTALAQRYRGSKFKINLDIKWVIGRETEHWNIDVYKVPVGVFRGSFVRWANRQIELDSQDTIPRTDLLNQVPVTHEFGHTFRHSGSSNYGTLDEYPDTSPHAADRYSIMNRGTEVRNRHYDYLKQQLNLLLPSASFNINLF